MREETEQYIQTQTIEREEEIVNELESKRVTEFMAQEASHAREVQEIEDSRIKEFEEREDERMKEYDELNLHYENELERLTTEHDEVRDGLEASVLDMRGEAEILRRDLMDAEGGGRREVEKVREEMKVIQEERDTLIDDTVKSLRTENASLKIETGTLKTEMGKIRDETMEKASELAGIRKAMYAMENDLHGARLEAEVNGVAEKMLRDQVSALEDQVRDGVEEARRKSEEMERMREGAEMERERTEREGVIWREEFEVLRVAEEETREGRERTERVKEEAERAHQRALEEAGGRIVSLKENMKSIMEEMETEREEGTMRLKEEHQSETEKILEEHMSRLEKMRAEHITRSEKMKAEDETRYESTMERNGEVMEEMRGREESLKEVLQDAEAKAKDFRVQSSELVGTLRDREGEIARLREEVQTSADNLTVKSEEMEEMRITNERSGEEMRVRAEGEMKSLEEEMRELSLAMEALRSTSKERAERIEALTTRVYDLSSTIEEREGEIKARDEKIAIEENERKRNQTECRTLKARMDATASALNSQSDVFRSEMRDQTEAMRIMKANIGSAERTWGEELGGLRDALRKAKDDLGREKEQFMTFEGEMREEWEECMQVEREEMRAANVAEIERVVAAATEERDEEIRTLGKRLYATSRDLSEAREILGRGAGGSLELLGAVVPNDHDDDDERGQVQHKAGWGRRWRGGDLFIFEVEFNRDRGGQICERGEAGEHGQRRQLLLFRNCLLRPGSMRR